MARQLIAVILLGCFAFQAAAQNKPETKPSTFVFHVFYNDFKTAQQLRTTSPGNIKWSSLTDMQSGFGFNYLKGINGHIDLVTTLDGSYTDYLYKNGTSNGSSRFLLDANAGFNIKLLTDNHPVVPYFSVGIGGSIYQSKKGIYAPIGIGLQFNLFNQAFVFSNMQYRAALTPDVNNHFQYNIGIGIGLGKKTKAKPVPPLSPVKTAEPVAVIAEIKLPVKDIIAVVTDEQTGLPLPGVEVSLSASNVKLKGTTDASGRVVFNGLQAGEYIVSGVLHGINTSVYHLTKPAFDTQEAGITLKISHHDPRFTLAGKVTNKTTGKPENGVMVSVDNATQNSGIVVENNEVNGAFSAQLEPGSDFTISGKKGGYISNIEKTTTKGLTRSVTLYVNLELGIEQALPDKTIKLSNIYYDSGSAKIEAGASGDLEKLIRFLKDNPDLKIEIASHTDSRGNKTLNLQLSRARALGVMAYLEKNNIGRNRMIPKGYGSSKPVNGCVIGVKCTAEQYEENRRTEFKVIGSVKF